MSAPDLKLADKENEKKENAEPAFSESFLLLLLVDSRSFSWLLLVFIESTKHAFQRSKLTHVLLLFFAHTLRRFACTPFFRVDGNFALFTLFCALFVQPLQFAVVVVRRKQGKDSKGLVTTKI